MLAEIRGCLEEHNGFIVLLFELKEHPMQELDNFHSQNQCFRSESDPPTSRSWRTKTSLQRSAAPRDGSQCFRFRFACGQ